jgi:hypothetical protein
MQTLTIELNKWVGIAWSSMAMLEILDHWTISTLKHDRPTLAFGNHHPLS